MADFIMGRMHRHTDEMATMILAVAIAVARNPPTTTDGQLWVESMVSARDQKPYVSIRWHDENIQLSLPDARSHILSLLEAVEAAASDAFLFNFMQARLNLDNDSLGKMLIDFRKFRENLDKES
jgi:hypothetical protein